MIKKLLKNQRGLTLIELLAVIVILGIIAAIAVPSIGGIISKTEDKAEVAEAIQIINAAKLARTSDSDATIFVHDDADATEVDLEEYLENVADEGYTVTYNPTNNDYTITGHVAVAHINATENASVTEDDLIEFAD